MTTTQGQQWQGEFGAEYLARSPGNVRANVHMFTRALIEAKGTIGSVLEYGCGSGANLAALSRVLPFTLLIGIEINGITAAAARANLTKHTVINVAVVEQGDLLAPPRHFADLVLTKGVLIHIAPENLATAYSNIYASARKWILLAEYFSPAFREIPYRGQRNMLWAGPHAYDMMDKYPDLQLVDYGFVSKRDQWPQDDLNWWLLKKG